jgi:hypothetical protein
MTAGSSGRARLIANPVEKLRLWHDQIDVVGLEAYPLSEWLRGT